MASLVFILGAIFVGVSLGAWALLASGLAGWGRYRETFTQSADSNLSQLFLFVDARKVFVINSLGLIAVPALVYGLTGHTGYAVAGLVAVFILPKRVYRLLARRRLQAFEAALPDALGQIAGALRAGATLPTAIEGMVRETQGPISQEFSLVLREQRVGVPLEEAFENLGERVRCEDLDLVIAAALIARDVGGNLAEIFERLSATLREKAAMEGKIRALTAQGKLQGWVVGLLPVLMILGLFQMEPEVMGRLTDSVLGWGVLAVIAVLELLGVVMIRKIVAIDV